MNTIIEETEIVWTCCDEILIRDSKNSDINGLKRKTVKGKTEIRCD